MIPVDCMYCAACVSGGFMVGDIKAQFTGDRKWSGLGLVNDSLCSLEWNNVYSRLTALQGLNVLTVQ